MESESKTKKRNGLTNTLKYLFGVGDAGFVLMSNVETFYFMRFLTNFAKFVPAVAGVINSVFSIIDAALSWIYGAIINGTRAKKWGRYRSWLVLTPWIVPFIFACQFIRFSDNVTLSAIIIVAAAVISHFIWNLGYVANSALVSVVGKTPDEKATLASSRATWNNLGSLAFSYLGLPFATLLAGVVGENNQFAAVAFVLGIVMVLTYFAHFKMTDGYEEIETENTQQLTKKNKMKFSEMLKALFTNPQLICLILADLAKWCVNFVVKAAAVYYWTDACNKAGMQVTYTLTTAIAAAVGAFLMRYVAKKLSSRTGMILSYVGMAVSLFLIYIFYANATLALVLITIAFLFYGVALASAPALYADAVTYTVWKTGKEASGWVMGLQNVPLKIAIFLRGVIIAAVLTSIAYNADEVKAVIDAGNLLPDSTRQALTIPFALVPAIFCAVGCILLIFGFRITKSKVEQYQKEIDAREAAEK